jgi:hypothetical protein
VVEFKEPSGRAPDRRPSGKTRTLKLEMIFPSIRPGIEQSFQALRVWVFGREVGALSLVAARARPSEIFEIIRASMASRPDMLAMKTYQFGQEVRQAAIFASASRSLTDLLP